LNVHRFCPGSSGKCALIQLKMLCSENVFAKAEFVNPGGSIEDRVAKHIIESAEEIGKVKPRMIILNK